MDAPSRSRTWREHVDDTYSDEVERFYESDADRVFDESLGPRGPEALFHLAGDLGLSAGWRVLDIGARDGRHLVRLADSFGCDAIGVEPALGNLARMRRSFPDQKPRVIRGLAEALPVADESFDLIWIRDVLVHVADLTQAMAQIRRALRPNAPVVVFHVFATDQFEAADEDVLLGPAAIVRSSIDRTSFADAVECSGLNIERLVELGSEWAEYAEERHASASRQLVRLARMRRRPEYYRSIIGARPYEVELGNALFSVFQLLGKLSAAMLVLR